ncbi:MAG: dynamin family protein [Clostridia bacterium]|nr:dynamin family protein [Clostridia bacterium]
MSLKNKSEDKINEGMKNIFAEVTEHSADTVIEEICEIEQLENKLMQEDTFEFGFSSATRAFADEKIRFLLDVVLKKDAAASIGNIRNKKFVIPEKTEKYIAISGDVTGGKSTFLNAICRYPICPSAETTTSICPVELRRVSFKDKERIEICFITNDGKKLSDKNGKCKVFAKQVFSPGLFEKLCAFVDYLIEKRIIKVDSLRYFEDTQGRYTFDRNNWRHTMILLMILFDTYLHEDKQNTDKDYKVACQMKKELFVSLGLDNFTDKDYGVRLYWCSDLIPVDSVIVDLPGTGSATEDSLHTKIVNNYLARVSSLLFIVDLTGNLTIEAQTTLDNFLNKMRSQRRDTSELVTFLMNKADTKDEGALQASIKAFRDNYKNYSLYSLYAISAISGEWLFMESDIEPEKTFMASKFKILRMPVTADVIAQRLQEGYENDRYPFSINGDDLSYNTASLSEFVEKHIEEYIGRLNFQGTINLFDDYTKYLSNLCQTVSEEIEILINASGISGKLAEELIAAVGASIEEAENEFAGNRMNFETDILDMNREFIDRTSSIQESFVNAYDMYNQKTNNSISAFVQRLEVKNGVIPIDGNILSRNEIGLRNRDKLIKFLKQLGMNLAQELTIRDSTNTFANSFVQLEEEFERERAVYREFLEKNIETLLSFSGFAENKLKEKFKNILSDNNIPEDFFKQTENIISNVCSLLKIATEEFAEDLLDDTSFEEAIVETTERMYNGLSLILSPYTKNDGNDYASAVFSAIQNFHFFKANSINMSKLDEFLKKQYVNDFSSKLSELIAYVFEGSAGEETDESHANRLTRAIEKFNLRLSQENMQKLYHEAEKACTLLKDMGQPEEIKGKLTQYREFADYIKNAFAENGHYRDIVDYIASTDVAVLKESSNDFNEIEKKTDSIIAKITDFKKVGGTNE